MGDWFGERGYLESHMVSVVLIQFMDAIEGIPESGWIRNTRIVGLWTNNSDRNSYAYVQDLGWRRISPDNDNIHIDMLTQLTAAKASGRRVDLYQERQHNQAGLCPLRHNGRRR